MRRYVIPAFTTIAILFSVVIVSESVTESNRSMTHYVSAQENSVTGCMSNAFPQYTVASNSGTWQVRNEDSLLLYAVARSGMLAQLSQAKDLQDNGLEITLLPNYLVAVSPNLHRSARHAAERCFNAHGINR